ncbi:MAG: diguanylate cyclase [Oscillospiraceae bacterium]|jgi:diguanylate cyclase (GGDEF)-like protein/PAS domain S-box-containing protein|nr:diguanylate cyclase [Oscillospiraceae bacterium]
MKSNLFSEIMTADSQIETETKTEHLLYSKTHFLNFILISLTAISLFYCIINLINYEYYKVTVNVIAAMISFAAWIFFKIYGNFKWSSLIAVLILYTTLFTFCMVAGHKNYALSWIAIFCPVSIYLLGSKNGQRISILYFISLLLLTIINYKRWQLSGFTFSSVYNIIGVNIALFICIGSFEKQRECADIFLSKENSELTYINDALKQSESQLRMILDSTANAIYGIDNNGVCTFCNTACVKLLGYTHHDELLGKKMHSVIKNSMPTSANDDSCTVMDSINSGKIIKVAEGLFVRADGTSFDAKYSSYPQFKGNDIVGAVITFEDISEQKKKDRQIEYLSNHDFLTGLYNRYYFTTVLESVDKEQNLPISIIFADVNSLKLTNDIFTHAAGDTLLVKTAEILKSVCRENDTIVRVGGDEFVIVMPKTDKTTAKNILHMIKEKFANLRVTVIQCSISMGCDTKTDINQPIEMIIENAENEMYISKTKNRKDLNYEIISTIMNTLHQRNPREKQHSDNVGNLCKRIGCEMNLPYPEVKKLETAGFLHDIGKIVLDKNILHKKGNLTDNEKREMQQHSVIGYRILNLFDKTLDLADGVYSHHERWDGSGYPKGLKGNEIPKIARIIAVAEAYDALVNPAYKQPVSKKRALEILKEYAGVRLDPEITDILINIISNDINSINYHITD